MITWNKWCVTNFTLAELGVIFDGQAEKHGGIRMYRGTGQPDRRLAGIGRVLADSGALAALEADLGVRLFNRSTRRIALTNEGLCYLDSCRHVLATLEEAESALREDTGELAGQLTITAPVLFGQMHVAPSLNRFVRQHHRCAAAWCWRTAR